MNNRDRHRKCARFVRGMTLIELIAVLALLSMVVGISAPALSPFFRGRRLNEEARRLLALTRYARNQAICYGVPMEIWFDQKTGEYGLRPQTGYILSARDANVTYQLGNDLQFYSDDIAADGASQPSIRFRPDGTLDSQSLTSVKVKDTVRNEVVEIAQIENRPAYEIRNLGVVQ